MKIIFMGTPDFAVMSLKALVENNYNVEYVITQPDKPVGRSGKILPPPVKAYAVSNNIPILQPQRIKDQDIINTIKSINPDLIVVVAFGQILPVSILNIPKFGCINVHGSLLPKYRGAAPIQWSIINGDKTTGITTMYMDKGMDTGDMILKREIEILKNDTSETLFEKMSILGAKTLIETIELIKNGNVKREKQNNNEATYAPMLKKENGCVDWNKAAIQIKNLLRGTYPWPGIYSFYKGKRFKIINIEIENKNYSDTIGKIINVSDEGIVVQTKEGVVIIKEVQFDGSKKMSVKSYLAGHSIEKNEVLHGDFNGGTC